MSSRFKKFLSYYRPYKGLFLADMICAFIAAGVTLVFPIITRYITGTVLNQEPVEFSTIYKLGIYMVVLVIVEYFCNYFIAYQGHVMGAKMERDLRSELFAHYQKLSFSFYDDQKTGQLMSRLTNDLFSLTELYHHGPEDIMISLVKFIGAFIILLSINVKLTLIVFAFLPVMFIFASYFNKKMNIAFTNNKRKIGDINARIEDNLSGIRVVQSFANEEKEKDKFAYNNNQYVLSKKNSYFYMAGFHSGLGAFISLITVVVVIFGAMLIAKEQLTTPDIIAFLLYIGNLTDPIKKLINFTEQFQDGLPDLIVLWKCLKLNQIFKMHQMLKHWNMFKEQLVLKMLVLDTMKNLMRYYHILI